MTQAVAPVQYTFFKKGLTNSVKTSWMHTQTHLHSNTQSHKHTQVNSYGLPSLSYFCKLNQMIFLTSNKAVFILLGWATVPPPSASHPSNQTTAGSAFPPESHWSSAMSAGDNQLKMLLRYSCSFSKAPNSIYGHIYYHVCQWLKGSFIIRSTHLIWSQQAASLGQYALYYTVRASRSTEEKENMSKQKAR